MARPTGSNGKRQAGDGHAPPRPPAPTDRQRLATIEATLEVIQQTLDVQFRRIAAMQAELDHLTANRPR